MLKQSNESKVHANSLFSSASYSEAIQGYDRALAALPTYLDYEIAVLKSNVAACHLKLQEWKEAVDSATASLDCLARLDPLPESSTDATSADVHEIDDATAARLEALEQSGHSHADIQRIRIKALLRRGKAREQLGGWMHLQGADDDYKLLSGMRELAPLDAQTVRRARATLPPRLEQAKQAEMGEMMGKLKDLGNGFLKNFGLSTDNFQFTKDEKSGGYSMNFNQGK